MQDNPKLILLSAHRSLAPDTKSPKVYVWHAPEIECIGKGKAHKPYEFSVKVSIAGANRRCKGGQFVLHTRTLPGNPLRMSLPEALRARGNQTGTPAPRRHRAGDRPREEQSRLGSKYPKGHYGDLANAALTAIGCNFRLIRSRLSLLLRLILASALFAITPRSAVKMTS